MDLRSTKKNAKLGIWLPFIIILLCLLYSWIYTSVNRAPRAPEIDWPTTGLATLIPAPEDPHGEIVQNTDQIFEVQLEEVSDKEYFFYASNLERNFKNDLPMQIYAEYVPELARWKTLYEMTDDSYQLFLQGDRQHTGWVMLSTYECSFNENLLLTATGYDKEKLREQGVSMIDERFQGYDTCGNQLSFSRIENRLTIEVKSCESVALSMKEYIPPVPEDAEDDPSENEP